MIEPFVAGGFPAGAPKVSFVMTAYRFREFIGEAVASVLAQTLGDRIELIVVDDASNDGTADVLHGISDPRLRVRVNPANLGAAQSINVGMALARGEYIARVDGDDRWHPEFAATLAAELDRDPDVGMVYADVRLVDAESRLLSSRGNLRRPRLPRRGDEWRPLLRRNYVCSPAVLARREAWMEVLPWQVDVGPGDWRGHLRIAAKWQLAFVDRPLADYRLHGGGMHATYQRTSAAERVVEETLAEMLALPSRRVGRWEVRRIRAGHARDLSFGYLAVDRADEADRLLRAALALDPTVVLDPATARQVFALFAGRSRYERVKGWLRRD
jgi:hypothetical protein